MASVLYKLVDGVVIQERIEIGFLDGALEHGGWSADPSGATKEEKTLDSDGDGEVTKEEADTNNTGKLSVKEIRAAAEEAGIEDFATARIKTLEAKLWPTQK
jgi:hypothetical protein